MLAKHRTGETRVNGLPRRVWWKEWARGQRTARVEKKKGTDRLVDASQVKVGAHVGWKAVDPCCWWLRGSGCVANHLPSLD